MTPFLSNHKTPEVSYLEVLSYYKLCLYKEAIQRGKTFLISSRFQIKKYNKLLELVKNRPNLVWMRFKRNKGNGSILGDYKSRIILGDFITKDKLMLIEHARLKNHIGLKNKGKIRRYLRKMINNNRRRFLTFYKKKIKKRIYEGQFFRKAILNLKAETFKRKESMFIYLEKKKKL